LERSNEYVALNVVVVFTIMTEYGMDKLAPAAGVTGITMPTLVPAAAVVELVPL
jgi:hypothetical protein